MTNVRFRTILTGLGPLAALTLAATALAAPAVVALRTRDGLKFEPETVTVMTGAVQPDVLLVPRATPSRNGPDAGAMLCFAVQSLSPTGPGAAGSGLLCAASLDQGRSWDIPSTVVINGWPKDMDGRRASGPAAVQLDDGRIRLYFALIPPDRGRGRPATPASPSESVPPARVYSAISNDGKSFALEDGVRFELSGLSDPEVIRLPAPADGDTRRIGPWLMFLTRDDSTLLATSKDGLTWTRDETFLWASARAAGATLIAADARPVRIYGNDRTGLISARYDPATGEIHPDPAARLSSESTHPSLSACGDGTHLLVCVRQSTDKPAAPLRDRPPVPVPPAPPAMPPVRPG